MEELVILGWQVNTRSLNIALPYKKFKIWIKDLNEMIKTRRAFIKTLENITKQSERYLSSTALRDLKLQKPVF
jgi:hypothetical protein